VGEGATVEAGGEVVNEGDDDSTGVAAALSLLPVPAAVAGVDDALVAWPAPQATRSPGATQQKAASQNKWARMW